MSAHGIVRRSIPLVLACWMLVGGCSDDDATDSIEAESSTSEPVTATSTTEPEPVDTPMVDDLLDADYLSDLAGAVGSVEGATLVAIVDSDGTAVSGGSGDANGEIPDAEDVFRIGSITKVLTSLTTLTLVEEGLIDLDAPASDYVTRVDIDPGITVRALLGHRSGIDNYTDVEGFFDTVSAESERVWEPEEQVNSVGDRALLFEPGSRFSYSNTNYTILGILIEEVTGSPYHEVVRERVIDPLGMSSTYLAGFEQGPEPFDPYLAGSDYDYTSIATSAWAAGAMVSNAVDLHTLFTALFDEEIVSSAMIDEITADSFYGLGVELDRWQGGLIGHGGGIPGYTTLVRHSTSSGITAFFASTDPSADLSPAADPVLDLLTDRDGEPAEAAAPPANDLLADAIVIDPSSLPFSVELDTTGATSDDDDVDAGCPAPATDASVWFSVTPTEDMTLQVSQDGSDYSAGISALTGSPGSLDLIECRPFAFVVEAEAGVTYYLQVFDGQDDGGGNGGILNFAVEVVR